MRTPRVCHCDSKQNIITIVGRQPQLERSQGQLKISALLAVDNENRPAMPAHTRTHSHHQKAHASAPGDAPGHAHLPPKETSLLRVNGAHVTR